MKRAVVLGVLCGLGCGGPTGPPVVDLGRGFDFAKPRDMAGSDGAMPMPDASVAPDMAAPGCTMIAKWPGLMPEAGFDPQYTVTFAESADKAQPPLQLLSVEDYHGAPAPKMV